MSTHTVKAFDQELTDLGRRIAEMGGIAERMLADATTALEKGDIELAQTVIEADPRLDAMERELEERAILMIAKRQPLAVDLRSVVSSLRIAADLERIGDLSKNIARRVVAIDGRFPSPKIVGGVKHMSELAQDRLKRVIDAYAERDVTEAIDIWENDEEIDQMHGSLFRELLTYMMEDPRNIGFCAHLLFCAKNIERIGDHATNIAETVHYLATGAVIVSERPRDTSAYKTVDG
jgi:phosphate transport system protein